MKICQLDVNKEWTFDYHNDRVIIYNATKKQIKKAVRLFSQNCTNMTIEFLREDCSIVLKNGSV